MDYCPTLCIRCNGIKIYMTQRQWREENTPHTTAANPIVKKRSDAVLLKPVGSVV
jgi:hypothetical protein